MKPLKLKHIFTLLMLVSILGVACHTTVWQNVNKDIEGVWTRMPVEPGYNEKWNFSDGQLSITVNDVPLVFLLSDSSTTTSIPYTIVNRIDNHYLYFENVKATNAPWSLPQDIKRWLIVKLTKDQLFLSAESKTGQKGGTQREFFKF